MENVVKDYYNSHAEQEWERLQTPLSAIEFASALRLIEKYFPGQGKVCDIGCGPGRYALELARKGYAVTLLDLSDELITLAKSKFKEAGLRADGFIVDDARNLGQFASSSYDAALLMGPMYHLIDPLDRHNVLKELKRMRARRASPAGWDTSWETLPSKTRKPIKILCNSAQRPANCRNTAMLRSISILWREDETNETHLSGLVIVLIAAGDRNGKRKILGGRLCYASRLFSP